MGDDLNFAQKFTRTASDGLALISKMDDPRAAGDSAVVIDMMTTLQRGAKRLRARNIYASAQDVLSALHHEDDVTLNGRINNLGSLVTEYARGLGELVETAAPAPTLTRTDKWVAARETLNALLPSASPTDADVLSRLMRAPVTLETMRPNLEPQTAETAAQDADIVIFTKKDAPDLPLPTPAPQPVKQDEGAIVTLDAMMRDVIADALSIARSIERTISLSYDMGDHTVSEFRAEELRTRLGKALSQIIRHSMSDDRVGHIDINLAGEQLHIMAGTTAVRVAIDPAKAPEPKSSIEAEAEQGLRAQLHALMDPMQGTVS